MALAISQAAPMSGSALLAQISRQVGLAQPPQPAGEQEGNGLTWTLYSFNARGVQVDMAIAEDEDKAYLILLQSSPDERDNLYQKVFLPMLDELEAL
jgi:hypothetical protein